MADSAVFEAISDDDPQNISMTTDYGNNQLYIAHGKN